MTPEELTSVVSLGESETLEFKASTASRRAATKTICAMLNTRGGSVLFGVLPDGKIQGQQVSDATLERLSNELKQIDPPAAPNVDLVNVSKDLHVIVVAIKAGFSPPYR